MAPTHTTSIDSPASVNGPEGGDGAIETDEAFFVVLANTTDVAPADAQAIGVILNED